MCTQDPSEVSNINIDNQVQKLNDQELNSDANKKKLVNRKVWTEREDKQLEEAIYEMGTNWREVAKTLIDRNPSQCAQRWKRIKPSSLRCRNSWSAEEDKQLINLIELHNKNWGKIAQVMSWRTGKQIRERFINKLNPEIKQSPWTKEEDLAILEAYQKQGSKWTEISKLLQGRPENMVKNRFYSYIRKEYMKIENPYYIIPKNNQIKEEERQQENICKNEQDGQRPNATTKPGSFSKKRIRKYRMILDRINQMKKMNSSFPTNNEYEYFTYNHQKKIKQETDQGIYKISPLPKTASPQYFQNMYYPYQYYDQYNYQLQYQQYMSQFMPLYQNEHNQDMISSQGTIENYPKLGYNQPKTIQIQPFQNLLNGTVVQIPVYVKQEHD